MGKKIISHVHLCTGKSRYREQNIGVQIRLIIRKSKLVIKSNAEDITQGLCQLDMETTDKTRHEQQCDTTCHMASGYTLELFLFRKSD